MAQQSHPRTQTGQKVFEYKQSDKIRKATTKPASEVINLAAHTQLEIAVAQASRKKRCRC